MLQQPISKNIMHEQNLQYPLRGLQGKRPKLLEKWGSKGRRIVGQEKISEAGVKGENSAIAGAEEAVSALRYALLDKRGLMWRKVMRYPHRQVRVVHEAFRKAVKHFRDKQSPFVADPDWGPDEISLCLFELFFHVRRRVHPHLWFQV